MHQLQSPARSNPQKNKTNLKWKSLSLGATLQRPVKPMPERVSVGGTWGRERKGREEAPEAEPCVTYLMSAWSRYLEHGGCPPQPSTPSAMLHVSPPLAQQQVFVSHTGPHLPATTSTQAPGAYSPAMVHTFGASMDP